MEYDLHHKVLPVVALASATLNTSTTTVGSIVDSKGFESLEFSIQSGTITDGTYTALLEEGDDVGLSDASVLSVDHTLDVLPVFDNTESDVVKSVGSIGKKRYHRLSIVSAGVTSGGVFSAQAVLSHVKHGPAQ